MAARKRQNLESEPAEPQAPGGGRVLARRRATLRFALAFLLLLATVLVLLRQGPVAPTIAGTPPDEIAAAVLGKYLEVSGEPREHFVREHRTRHLDSWEYEWRFLPCLDEGALRFLVRRDGEIRILELPNCANAPPAGVHV